MTLEFKKCPTSVTTWWQNFYVSPELLLGSRGDLLFSLPNIGTQHESGRQKGASKIADQNCGMFRQRSAVYRLGINYDEYGNKNLQNKNNLLFAKQELA